jgi:hypothetical protein
VELAHLFEQSLRSALAGGVKAVRKEIIWSEK